MQKPLASSSASLLLRPASNPHGTDADRIGPRTHHFFYADPERLARFLFAFEIISLTLSWAAILIGWEWLPS